jgi:hypothetical protein
MQVGLTDLSFVSGATSPTHACGFEWAIMRDPNPRAAQLTLAVERRRGRDDRFVYTQADEHLA